MNNIPKMVIVVRKDLNMRKGKISAQSGHAVLGAVLNPDLSVNVTPVLSEWYNGLGTKICVSVDSDAELLDIYNKAIDNNLNVKLVKDMGLTEFHGVETLTCLAIGPDYPDKIDPITNHLKLL